MVYNLIVFKLKYPQVDLIPQTFTLSKIPCNVNNFKFRLFVFNLNCNDIKLYTNLYLYF